MAGALTMAATTFFSCSAYAIDAAPVGDKGAKPNRDGVARSVCISEVCFWPKEGEPEWIELVNKAETDASIGGWKLIDGNTLDFTIPKKLPKVPPGGYVLILLNGPYSKNQRFLNSLTPSPISW